MTTARYAVTGLTCGFCVVEVMEHVRDLVGVTGVGVDLVKDGPSHVMVTSGPAVVIGQIREAVGAAGFDLTGEWAGESEEGTTRVANSPSAARSPNENATREGVR